MVDKTWPLVYQHFSHWELKLWFLPLNLGELWNSFEQEGVEKWLYDYVQAQALKTVSFYFLPLGSLIQGEANSHARSPIAKYCHPMRKRKLATREQKNSSSSYLAMLAIPAQAPEILVKKLSNDPASSNIC